MQQTTPTEYTGVTQEQFDAFRYQARARGLTITQNAETVEFDRIPVTINYKPETKVLTLAVAEPHWLTPGVTLGILHSMLAVVLSGRGEPAPASQPTAGVTTQTAQAAANAPTPAAAAQAAQRR